MKSFHSLKSAGGGGGGALNGLPCLEGGHTEFQTHDFPIL